MYKYIFISPFSILLFHHGGIPRKKSTSFGMGQKMFANKKFLFCSETVKDSFFFMLSEIQELRLMSIEVIDLTKTKIAHIEFGYKIYMNRGVIDI